MKKAKALLLKYLPFADEKGNITKTLAEVGKVQGYFLPYSSEMASNSSGYSENSAWNFFYRGNNAEILTGNVIRYKDENYHIVNVSDMGRMKVVKLNRVVGTKSTRSSVQVLNY